MVRNFNIAILLTLFLVVSLFAESPSKSIQHSLNFSQNSAVDKGTSFMLSQDKQVKKEEKGDAFLKSVLVPGWGQLSTGRKRTGTLMLATEIALWCGVVGLRSYANWLEDDYRNFAVQHAGVSRDMGHQYYVDIGNWYDSDSYNEQRLRDRQYDRLYSSPETYWRWDTDDNRQTFKEMRLSSDKARQRSVLVIGGILMNHLISGIEAGRGASTKASVHSHIEIDDNNYQYRIGVTFNLR